MEKLTCKTGLKPGQISKDVFDREVLLCSQLAGKNGRKCGWGECDKCGVIPLLIKFHEGRILEDAEEIDQMRIKYLPSSRSLNSSA